QKRWCALIAYSGDTGERLLALPRSRWNETNLTECLCSFIGGGSTLHVPVGELPRCYQEIKAPVGHTDLLFITDAQSRIPGHDAGLDESVARELAPRHAFSRACKKLSEARIIRQVAEDELIITFQFTAERRDCDRFEYELETMLTLEKATGKVSCALSGLATL